MPQPQEPSLNDLNKAMGVSMENELKTFEHGKIPDSPVIKEEVTTEEPETPDTDKKEVEQPKVKDFGDILGETSEIVKQLGKKEEEKKDEGEDDDEEVKKDDRKDGKDTSEDSDEAVEEEEIDYRKDPKDEGKPVRVLDGFGEREAKWLKRMPYDAYEYFSKALKDSRAEKAEFEKKISTLQGETKIELPPSYYANPKAVVLSPEYEEAQGAIGFSQEIEQHWKTQLARIEKGEEWYDLVQDPKTGQIFVKKEGSEPTVDNKIAVMGWYQQTANQTQRLIGKLDTITNDFKTKAANFDSQLKVAEKQYMPLFEDTKGEEYKVYEQVAGELPKIGINKDNPAFRMLAKSCALNLILKDIILKGQKASVNKDKIQEEAKRAGPTAKHTTGGNNNTGRKPTAASLSDFRKAGLPDLI